MVIQVSVISIIYVILMKSRLNFAKLGSISIKIGQVF